MNERVSNWIRFAEEDLLSAKVLFKEGIYNKVCFHSQQSVENSLKALLLFRGKTPPKIHSLVELLGLVTSFYPELEKFTDTCRHLDLYYLPTRYADALVGTLPEGAPTEKHGRDALASAESILEEIKKIISV